MIVVDVNCLLAVEGKCCQVERFMLDGAGDVESQV
jgi:hypothetical protein